MSRKDVFPKVDIPAHITSLERFRQILEEASSGRSDRTFQGLFIRQEREFRIGLEDEIYCSNQFTPGTKATLISNRPVVVAYTEGGVEYFKDFIGSATDQPLLPV